jgi:hypothetical protein
MGGAPKCGRNLGVRKGQSQRNAGRDQKMAMDFTPDGVVEAAPPKKPPNIGQTSGLNHLRRNIEQDPTKFCQNCDI